MCATWLIGLSHPCVTKAGVAGRYTQFAQLPEICQRLIVRLEDVP